MLLKMKWLLQAPEDSTGTPSGSSLPATTTGTTPEIPDVNQATGGGAEDESGATTRSTEGGAQERDNADEQEPSVDWNALSTPEEAEPEVTEGDRGEPQKPAEQQQPAPQQKQEQQQAAPEQQAPEQKAQEQAQPPAAETPEQKTAREAAERQAQEQAAADYQKKLEEYYKIPEDLAARLQSEPELVLPTLAAKVHQAVVEATRQMMYTEMPQMIANVQQRTEAEEKSKTAFYTRWPQLKGHEKQVLQVGKMYRQMNPKAPAEQAIEKIGQVVLAALGLTDQAPQGGQKPAAAPPQKSTFRPAATSASGPGPAPASDNIYTQMAEEFLQEDQG